MLILLWRSEYKQVMNMKKRITLLFCLGIIVGLMISFFLNGSTAIEIPFSGSDIAKIEKFWTIFDYELSGKEKQKTTEWSIKEIETLFLNNRESEWNLIECVSVYDFAYDRVGVVLFTKRDTECINVAFMDGEGTMPYFGVEAVLDENIEFTYHGNGEVTFNVWLNDEVKYKQRIVFSKYNDEVKFVSESLEY